jgi:sugar phosphate isomerase/epimerase
VVSISGAVRVALSTGSLYNWSLDRVFELAQASGFDGVELLVDARMESYDEGYLNRLSREHSVPIVSVHTPFAARAEGWPSASEERVQQAVGLAERLGAETVVAHLPLRRAMGHVELAVGEWRRRWDFLLPWGNRAGERYARWLVEEMAELQARTPLRIAIENMPARRVWGRPVAFHHFSEPEQLVRFPYLVLDTTHWGTRGVDPVSVYETLKDRIVHVHLADYDGREHRLPFKGGLGLERLLQAMAAAHFSGTIVVESEPWAIGGISTRLRQTAAAIRAHLASSHSHSHPRPLHPTPLVRLG